jgi:hypothetical protein
MGKNEPLSRFFIEPIASTRCVNFSARKVTKKWTKMSLYQDFLLNQLLLHVASTLVVEKNPKKWTKMSLYQDFLLNQLLLHIASTLVLEK